MCKHKQLHFGSGGYYVLCSRCGAMWVATKPHTGDKPDPTRGHEALWGGRFAPMYWNDLPPFKKAFWALFMTPEKYNERINKSVWS